MWQLIITWVVTAVIAYALRPKTPDTTQGPGTVEVPTAEEGKSIPVLFGTRDISSANCVWYGDLRTEPIKAKGGKK
jgi:hypothetical protein